MREIKFRAWNKLARYFRQWEDLNLYNLVALSKDDNWVLQEYTGLRDNSGNEIYEGDNVKWYTWDGYYGSSTVVFTDGQFYPVASNCLEYQRFDHKRGFEIIGHVYENSGLLDI